MTVNNQTNVRACLTVVEENMVVESETASEYRERDGEKR